ncbi:hypothetical protein AK86_08380 [Streptococcus pneumoniae B1599]|nr:hypothetical protein AK86_08380 [Streptococcus pneumoniae B1599]
MKNKKPGKKRMKAIGSVEVPQEAFLSVLSMDGRISYYNCFLVQGNLHKNQ